MKLFKLLYKVIIMLVLMVLLYGASSLILSSITVNNHSKDIPLDHYIYLNTNGVHLDIVIPLEELATEKFQELKYNSNEKYLSFGWGEENFYIHTPTWGDLTFENGFRALFLKSSSLMHVTRYKAEQTDWVKVYLTRQQLNLVNTYLSETFKKNDNQKVIKLNGITFTANDDFYKAYGSYTLFYTCNTWVNEIFKKSELKSCYWTPFDFPLLNKYK